MKIKLMKGLLLGLATPLLALTIASDAWAPPPPPTDTFELQCGDGYGDRTEGYVWVDYYTTCFGIELKCEGGAYGRARMLTPWGKHLAVGLQGEARTHLDPDFQKCRTAAGPTDWDDGSFNFRGVKQWQVKCEFSDGSKVEAQVQRAEGKRCVGFYLD
jgi:hypothetical protein